MQKRLLRLMAVFAVLIGVSVALYFKGRPVAKSFNPLSSIDKDKIVKVAFENPTGKFALDRSDKRWKVLFPEMDVADPAAAQQIVDTVHDFTLGSIVSESASHYEQFNLGKNEATHLQVFVIGNSSPVLDGYIGKQGNGYSDSYFRLEGQAPVYLAHELPGYAMRRNANDFRLRKLLVPAADFTHVSIEGKVSLEVTRSSTTWTNDKSGRALDQAQVKALSEKLGGLYVAEFGNPNIPPPILGFEKPFLKIVVRGANPVTAVIGAKFHSPDPKGKPTYYAQTEGRNAVLVIKEEQVDDLVSFLKKLSS